MSVRPRSVRFHWAAPLCPLHPFMFSHRSTSLCHLLDKHRTELSYRIRAVQVMAAITQMAYSSWILMMEVRTQWSKYIPLWNISCFACDLRSPFADLYTGLLWPSHNTASLDSPRLLLLHHSWHGTSKQQGRVYLISVVACPLYVCEGFSFKSSHLNTWWDVKLQAWYINFAHRYYPGLKQCSVAWVSKRKILWNICSKQVPCSKTDQPTDRRS
jgi:hypothetical protein